MADQASRERDAAIIELAEAIRQSDRYLASPNPSTRIIKQKVGKITDKAEAFKGSHYNYCRLAKIDLTDPTQIAFFNEKLDLAEDGSDRALIVIADREDAAATTEHEIQNENAANAQEANIKTKISQLKSLLVSDKDFATELINMNNQITEANVVSDAFASQVSSYNERLFEIDEKINTSWVELVLLHTTSVELEQITAELNISGTRSNIQDARSKNAAFIQKCQPKTPASTTESVSEVSTPIADNRLLRPQKMNYPTFRGDIRNFARFQKDFEKIVTPFYSDPSQRAYVLKENCLKGDTKRLVENIEDIELIWTRLIERYGNKMDLVDVVIKELDETPKR